jgi:hypothetical protein
LIDKHPRIAIRGLADLNHPVPETYGVYSDGEANCV